MSSEAANVCSKSSFMFFTREFMPRCRVIVVHESSIACALLARAASSFCAFSWSRSAVFFALNCAWFTLYSASAAL